ncbi:hypothetical protein [Nonomuraea indica]|uniref:hypothetical protein n=1 Tax=Nonomuraea indica TaxID=1581193 RepID=UPI000C7E5B69|nr:hypothetical protein [Nonomuraea indica]
MIADRSHAGHEQELIAKVLATIEERLNLAKQVTAAQLRDEIFTKQRFSDMADDLKMAHDTIQYLNDFIAALLAPPPDKVVAAMRSKPGSLQPVSWRVGGKMRTFLVPGFGHPDVLREARWWRRMTNQYGEAIP